MARKKDSNPSKDTEAVNDKAAERRVALLRGKLTDAMKDPLTREQIVRAIRAMMQEK